MNNRIDAIYARQSVDKKDSISIESQIEFCKYELKGGNCKEYTDKGYSGKNTDRPKFQELVRDIKRGLIAKVIVYKLDRISRSILDFANMMELFIHRKSSGVNGVLNDTFICLTMKTTSMKMTFPRHFTDGTTFVYLISEVLSVF